VPLLLLPPGLADVDDELAATGARLWTGILTGRAPRVRTAGGPDNLRSTKATVPDARPTYTCAWSSNAVYSPGSNAYLVVVHAGATKQHYA
jgi:hypothetical protein